MRWYIVSESILHGRIEYRMTKALYMSNRHTRYQSIEDYIICYVLRFEMQDNSLMSVSISMKYVLGKKNFSFRKLNMRKQILPIFITYHNSIRQRRLQMRLI